MRIFNIKHILARRVGRDNDAINMLEEHFGNNYMYCGWGNTGSVVHRRRLGLESSPLANPYTDKSNARVGRIRVASRDHIVILMVEMTP